MIFSFSVRFVINYPQLQNSSFLGDWFQFQDCNCVVSTSLSVVFHFQT